MKMHLSSGVKVTDPSDEQIRTLLGRFNVGRDGEGFAIFEKDGSTYMQVGGDKTRGFDMEYQEGDVDKHYRAEREDFSLDEVVRAMIGYRDGNINWSDYGLWSRITF